jgi:hypothetical protein
MYKILLMGDVQSVCEVEQDRRKILFPKACTSLIQRP